MNFRASLEVQRVGAAHEHVNGVVRRLFEVEQVRGAAILPLHAVNDMGVAPQVGIIRLQAPNSAVSSAVLRHGQAQRVGRPARSVVVDVKKRDKQLSGASAIACGDEKKFDSL